MRVVVFRVAEAREALDAVACRMATEQYERLVEAAAATDRSVSELNHPVGPS
jgi:hypothetical protein